jgi:hypothetical protein
MLRPQLPLLAITLAAACSDDPAGPRIADLGGTWSISFSNLVGPGVICNSNTGTMSLTMSGATFSGTYGPITLSCRTGAGGFQDNLEGTVVNGSVGIEDVSFDLDDPDLHQSGKAGDCLPGECAVPPSGRPTVMNGGAQWIVTISGGPVITLNGTWLAAKQ